MIRNIVLFKLNEGLTRESPEVVEGFELVRNLGREIPEIRQWEVSWHVFEGTPVSYDFALNSLFEDEAAFQRYFHHPAHQAAIGHWLSRASWAVIDMDVDVKV
ncbi:Dabb family protein [Streptomyces sp. NPDC051954]|jgi:stress responsive alpha/beta barrel protein|uniref:Dabb family protein n=1 Tax=unclassified Streptomyces TaxID=2593676 RepID=UPI003441FA6A